MEKLSKNFIWMAAANIVSSLFGIVVFIYLARTLEPQAFGYFSYAFTIIFFMANFLDLGLSTYGIREIAKDRGRISAYVSEIVSFRLIICIALTAFILIAVSLWQTSSLIKLLILESIAMLFVCGLASEWAFQGVEKMSMVFVSFCVTNILQLGFLYLFIKKPSDVWKAPIIYFLTSLPIIIIFLRMLRFRAKIQKEDFGRMTIYLSSALVIWSISVFAQVYNSLDIFILGLFRDIEEVGYFTIVRRVIGGGTFLLIFLANAVLPHLSLCFGKDSAEFRSAVQKFLKIVVLLTVFIFLPVVFFSKDFIMITVGSEYLPAQAPLAIMMIGLIFVAFNLPYSTALIACGLEKEVLKQTIGSAGLSLISNFILVPKYGMIGASISFLAAEALALVWIVWVYDKKMKEERW